MLVERDYCETEWKEGYRAGTHLRPGNTNVSITHFIDDSDDSDIFVYHLPDLLS